MFVWYACRVPGSHHASVAASAAAIRSQCHRSSFVSGSRMAGTMAQRLAERGALLPPDGEIRPYGADRVIEADEPGVDELQGEEGDDRLSHRIDVHQGVGLPGSLMGLVRPSTDEVDHHGVADDHADAGAHFAPLGEVACELVADRGEAAVRQMDGPTGRGPAGEVTTQPRTPPRSDRTSHRWSTGR